MDSIKSLIDDSFFKLAQSDDVIATKNQIAEKFRIMSTRDAINVLKQRHTLKYHEEFFFPHPDLIFRETKDRKVCEYIVDHFDNEDDDELQDMIQEIKDRESKAVPSTSLQWKIDLAEKWMQRGNAPDSDDSSDKNENGNESDPDQDQGQTDSDDQVPPDEPDHSVNESWDQ